MARLTPLSCDCRKKQWRFHGFFHLHGMEARARDMLTAVHNREHLHKLLLGANEKVNYSSDYRA